jgi:Ca-activated chloride channel family protein
MKRVLCMVLLAATARAQQQPVFRVETNLVEAYVNVFDRQGNPLPNLGRDRFHIVDAGRPQSVLAFEGVEEPLSCAILLDITGSMEAFLPSLKASVTRFIDQLPEGGQVAIYTFNTTLKTAQAFTADRREARKSVMGIMAAGGTALFDSVAKVTADVERRKGKKALVVFTDGDDNASRLSASSASNGARRAGVPLYVIAQGEALRNATLMKTLEALASDTGGLQFRLYRPNKIDEVFSEINRNLRHTYLLAWKPADDAGSSWHPIQISVAGAEGAVVRTRQGYWPQ